LYNGILTGTMILIDTADCLDLANLLLHMSGLDFSLNVSGPMVIPNLGGVTGLRQPERGVDVQLLKFVKYDEP
jgi:hypothetical protein